MVRKCALIWTINGQLALKTRFDNNATNTLFQENVLEKCQFSSKKKIYFQKQYSVF